MPNNWNIEEITGYKPLTNIYYDLSVAEETSSEKLSTFIEESFEKYKSNYKLLTELVLALNWKLWEHYDANNMKLAKIYDKYWRKYDCYACSHLKNDELSYYYNTTD